MLYCPIRSGAAERRRKNEAGMDQASVPKRRLNPYGRDLRRARIFARLREGWAYGDIAQEERLTSRRIPQIVRETLQRRAVDGRPEHAMLPLAPPQPPLRRTRGAPPPRRHHADPPHTHLLP